MRELSVCIAGEVILQRMDGGWDGGMGGGVERGGLGGGVERDYGCEL